MSDVFDPFNIDEDDPNVSFSSNTSMNAFMNFENSFETDNNNPSQNNGSPDNRSKSTKLIGYSPVRVERSMQGVDSDIFSELFRGKLPSPSPSKVPHQPFKSSLPSTPSHLNDGEQTLCDSFVISVHEQMSCIYDSIPSSQASIEIKGTISLRPSKEVEGKAMYIALNDVDKHIKDVTSFFEIAKDVSENVCEREESKFVAMKQEVGQRVFKVKIPSNLQILGSKPINLIKYSGSENFRPIPLLVTNKVRVAGNFCRVGLKIRSNPINKQNMENIVVIMAVPPDVSGESMKMSRKGGMWDSMKRVIVYKHHQLQMGETLEVQFQFNYLADNDSDNISIPSFPVLVRCDCFNDQLSTLNLEVVYAGDEELNVDFDFRTSYEVYHRKV